MTGPRDRKRLAERNRELEAKYGGTFREAFGTIWPTGPNRGEIAMDYMEWVHLVSSLAKENRGKHKEGSE